MKIVVIHDRLFPRLKKTKSISNNYISLDPDIYIFRVYRDFRESLIYDEIKEGDILLYHSGSSEEEIKRDMNKHPFVKKISNDQHINSMINGLPGNIGSIADILNKYAKSFIPSLISSRLLVALLPLHISIQAFLGISRNEDECWVYYGNERKNGFGLSQAGFIQSRLKSGLEDLFPNENAFLLVQEAEWDFYASIFDKLMPSNKSGVKKGCRQNSMEEAEDYEEESKVAYGLEKLLELQLQVQKPEVERLRKLSAVFSFLNSLRDIKSETSDEIFFENATYSNFVECLRELCAILANTISISKVKYRKDNRTFCYKGQFETERDQILRSIFNKAHDLGSTRHSKLPDANGNPTPDYDNLKNQIIKWAKQDSYLKAKIVIQGIEEMAQCLNSFRMEE